MIEQTQQKIAYETPKVEKIGDFQDVTQHGGGHSRLDADFGSGSAASDLTFS